MTKTLLEEDKAQDTSDSEIERKIKKDKKDKKDKKEKKEKKEKKDKKEKKKGKAEDAQSDDIHYGSDAPEFVKEHKNKDFKQLLFGEKIKANLNSNHDDAPTVNFMTGEKYS